LIVYESSPFLYWILLCLFWPSSFFDFLISRFLLCFLKLQKFFGFSFRFFTFLFCLSFSQFNRFRLILILQKFDIQYKIKLILLHLLIVDFLDFFVWVLNFFLSLKVNILKVMYFCNPLDNPSKGIFNRSYFILNINYLFEDLHNEWRFRSLLIH